MDLSQLTDLQITLQRFNICLKSQPSSVGNTTYRTRTFALEGLFHFNVTRC